MRIEYVSIGDVLRIIAANGWHPRDALALDTVVTRPRAFMYGTELYPGLHTKAAAMMDSANRQHPLLDGNKRLSWMLASMFYDLNGLEIVTTQDEGEEFVLAVAGAHLELEEIAAWFADHTHERQD